MHDTIVPPSPKQYAVLSLIHIPNTRLNTRDGVPALTHHWVNVPRDPDPFRGSPHTLSA